MSGSIEISPGDEHIGIPSSITQLSDAVLHPDFPRYYRDALHNPEHPNGWGNAVLLLDMLSEMNSPQPLEAIIVAQYQSPHKDPDDIDKPRLYKESLARAIVDLAQLTGTAVEVITARDLDRINGRIKWTASGAIPDREAMHAILGDIPLPDSLIALRDHPEEINHTRRNVAYRKPSRLWDVFHNGEEAGNVPHITENQRLIRLGITTSCTPDQAFDTNRVLLLPQNNGLKT